VVSIFKWFHNNYYGIVFYENDSIYIYILIYIYYIYNIPHENDDFGDGFSGRKMALVV